MRLSQTLLGLPICMASILTLRAFGTVTTYTNKSSWQSAAGSWSTVTFTELPLDTLVTDQYADLGVTFTDGSDYTLYSPTSFPTDHVGLNGAFDTIDVAFSAPMTSIAVEFPGNVKFKLYSQGKLIYTSPMFGQFAAGNFGGLVTDTTFDSAEIYDPFGEVFIDNLHFGPPIPAPSALALLGAGVLLRGCGRRRA
jgi:hypothetical protein